MAKGNRQNLSCDFDFDIEMQVWEQKIRKDFYACIAA